MTEKHCECGCKKIVRKPHNRFIHGHHGRKDFELCDYGHLRNRAMSNGRQGISWRCGTCDGARRLARKYGITFEQALAMPDNCEICGRHKDDPGTPWNTMTADHCHVSELFRGWLCGHCNKGLAGFKDSIPNLKNAIRYLRRFHNAHE